MRKALARLLAPRAADPQGDRPQSSEASGPLPSQPETKTFWSDFSRQGRKPQPDEDQTANGNSARLNILVPFDFTTSSCAALDCALRMAQNGKAQITLLHAIHLSLSPYGPANPALIKQELRQAAKAKISGLVALARQRDISVDSAVQDGKPCAVIERFIQEHAVDLVIIGRHQHRGLGWFGRRRLAEKVVRKALCPVLVLQSDEEERTLS